jgi:transglycosylase-like protein
MMEWRRVAMCEEGGNWHVRGPLFSGGLGISDSNWVYFGGRQFASNASLATPVEQVIVAMRIQSNPPDQNGCTGSW